MIAEGIKTAAKVAAVTAVLVAIVAAFASFMPTSNLVTEAINVSISYINVGYSICVHYFPPFSYLYSMGLALLALEISFITLKIGSIVYKFIINI